MLIYGAKVKPRPERVSLAVRGSPGAAKYLAGVRVAWLARTQNVGTEPGNRALAHVVAAPEFGKCGTFRPSPAGPRPAVPLSISAAGPCAARASAPGCRRQG